MKVLIDTCIIIDFLQMREPFAADAKKIISMAATEQIDAYTTAKAAADIHYLTKHATHNEETTRNIMQKLFSLIGVLDSTATDAKNALFSDMKDYEDAMMVQTAQRMAMDCIVTRNEKDYRNAEMKIYSPTQFVKTLSNS